MGGSMRLMNKKTGEIGELQITEKYCAVAVGNGTANCGIEIYSSLAELSSEWEDAPEEPKRYWYMSNRGDIRFIDDKDTDWDNDRKQIGNYFETKEEAEKAVEKLKAAKRLKDKGFRFDKWFTRVEGGIQINVKYPKYDGIHAEDKADLDLLFGDEDE